MHFNFTVELKMYFSWYFKFAVFLTRSTAKFSYNEVFLGVIPESKVALLTKEKFNHC